MIEGRRVKLRLMRIEDIPNVCNLLRSDTAVMLSEKFGRNLDEDKITEEFKAKLLSEYTDRMYIVAVNRKAEIIGFVAITDINFIRGNAEYSILVSEKYLGLGYGPLIANLVIRYCFEELNLIKLHYKIRIDNKRLINIKNREKYQILRKMPTEFNSLITYCYGEIIKSDLYKD